MTAAVMHRVLSEDDVKEVTQILDGFDRDEEAGGVATGERTRPVGFGDEPIDPGRWRVFASMVNQADRGD